MVLRYRFCPAGQRHCLSLICSIRQMFFVCVYEMSESWYWLTKKSVQRQ